MGASNTTLSEGRLSLTQARTIVIKIGSKALSRDAALPCRLAEAAANLWAAGKRVVLVSSGAVALGMKHLGYESRPTELTALRAAAALGQGELIRRYSDAFRPHGLECAQVLMIHSDLADRQRTNNAREVLKTLLDAGVTPIVNENDAVSAAGIDFGDNDQLASLVMPLVDGDALVLLSDVDGLLDDEGAPVPLVQNIAAEAKPLTKSGTSDVGKGGMESKLEAAYRSTRMGSFAVIANAQTPQVVQRLFEGEELGTLFVPGEARLKARLHWIAYALRPKGTIILDKGATRAVKLQKRSLLPVGVLGVRGDFHRGDAVSLCGPDGVEFARGLCRIGFAAAAYWAGRKAQGEEDVPVVVHRDDLMVFNEYAE